MEPRKSDIAPVCVADASVLIDLGRGLLWRACFRLPFPFAVPDLLFTKELADYDGDQLMQLGLRIEDLDGGETAQAIEFHRQNGALSLPDCTALALALGREWTLLTGDRRLRKLADDQGVPCHGVLWLLDEMLRLGAATPVELFNGLDAIVGHPRCRLPKREVNIRLRNYESRIAARPGAKFEN